MIFRERKDKSFTVISNFYLKDKRLSLKSKGLLTVMLGLPNDWNYSLDGLTSICREGIKSIRSAIKELQNNGYLIVEKKQDHNGQFIYEYNIYEKPHIQKGGVDLAGVEKDILLNTNNKEIKYKDKLDKSNLNSITLKLINRKFITEDSLDIVRYDQLFNEIIRYYDYYSILMATSYTISRMKDKTTDEEGNPILHTFEYFRVSLLKNLRRITDDSELFN